MPVVNEKEQIEQVKEEETTKRDKREKRILLIHKEVEYNRGPEKCIQIEKLLTNAFIYHRLDQSGVDDVRHVIIFTDPLLGQRFIDLLNIFVVVEL